MNYRRVKDSGEREEFETGSRRDTQKGKGRFDLLPFIALRRLALHYEHGSEKYGDHNWRKGQPLSRYFSSAMRHMIRWMLGWKDEDHLAAAVWNLCAIIETEEMIRRGKLPHHLDDRHEDLLDDYDWELLYEPIETKEVKTASDSFVSAIPNRGPFTTTVVSNYEWELPHAIPYDGPITTTIVASGVAYPGTTLRDIPLGFDHTSFIPHSGVVDYRINHTENHTED